MIERIIQFSIKNKVIVGLLVLALIGWGTYSLTRLPIDATPDITNNQVQIIALAPSLAVQEVESSITAPIEVAVASIPDIIELRSISRLGLSVITVVFKDEVDVYWARQQMNERLKEAEEQIPQGLAKIELAPISTGLGEIYQYRLAVDDAYAHDYDPMELRTLQDWVVRREMLGTVGVADINSYGGYVKQYEIAVNPERLRGMNLTLTDIFDALERNNENTGSAYIDKKPTAFFIRGIGMVKTLEDIGQIVVKSNPSGIPVLIRDVATVQFGSATRYGAFMVDTAEAVGGVVMMLKGANAHEVVKNVEERIQSIQKSLPEGVHIEPYLNRSDLVDRAIGTVSRNLIEGALIVIFILILFLGNLRAGLVVASVIPLSMLFAVSLMNLFGVSGNLMSLGAIDFGLIVDGAVIIVESVVHRITQSKHHHPGVERLSQPEMDENVFQSAKRMMSSATFGQVIILIVYVPIMALVGIEGKMFRPMAEVVAFALIGATILSLTYVPMMSSLVLSKNTTHKRTFSDWMMDGLHRLFHPAIQYALKHKLLVSVSSLMLFLASIFVFSRLGGEFIPQLEEGDLAAGVVTLQGGSLSNTIEQVQKANSILLRTFPEIKHVVCKIGAGEIPTDPTPLETGDYIITLKDKDAWTSAKTREELVEKMEEALIPLAGVKFEFQQPIQMRTNELLSGSKQDIAVKIFGDDLNTLSEKAAQVERLIQQIPGVDDINVEKVTGLAQIQVEYNRDRLAQYGLSVSEVNRVLRTAFAGSQAGMVFDDEKRFGMVVRLDQAHRESIEDVKNLSVAMPGGGQIPFEELASVEIKSGPAQVSREDTKRRITIGFNVRNRDIQSVIHDVEQQIDAQIALPTGYFVRYGGQFENLEAAKNRLAIAVPVALLLIFVLLYFAFRSVKQALLIYTAVPMSLIGGIVALWMRGMNFSISAGIGFIALFGIAVLNGIVLIAEFNRLEKEEGITDSTERILKGLHTRLRPVIMTATVASLGFLPMALSTSAGAEVQKPLATVVIGGLITATLLTLLILPVFYSYFSNPRSEKRFRKIRTRKTLLPLLLLLIVGSAQAQQPLKLTLQQAMQQALEANVDLRSASLEVEAQKALKGAGWDLPKTSIDLQYGQFNTAAYDNGLTISQSMAFPTVYAKQHKLAAANVKSSDWKRQQQQLELVTQVKQAFNQWNFLQASMDLLKTQDSLFATLERTAGLRAQSGETSSLEHVTARTQRLEVRNQQEQLQAEIRSTRNQLQLLLNSPDAVEPLENSLQRLTYTPPSVSEQLHPSLAVSQQKVVLAKAETELEQSKLLPDLSVGYVSQTITGETGGPRFNGVQAGIAVPLLFGSSAAKIKAAKLHEQVQKLQSDQQAKAFEVAYQNLLNDFTTSNNNLTFFEKQALPEATLLLKQANQLVHTGSIDYLEYVQSLNRAFTLKQQYLEALNRFNQIVIQLEYLSGKTH